MGVINKDLGVFKTEYEDKIRKYIASQDLVGRYFITKVETMDSSACVRSEWNDACNTTRFLFNIYKVIEQTEDNVTCRFLKIVDQIEHSFERCYEKEYCSGEPSGCVECQTCIHNPNYKSNYVSHPKSLLPMNSVEYQNYSE